jgi:surfactin synthase thioesterase subunit
MNKKIENKWIAHDIQGEGNQVNFICFPYAGGSPSVFAPWKTEMPKGVNFFPVLYPGRELRKNDLMPDSIDAFVEAFVDQTMELYENDFILFGHCTGTLIAYKVLLEIRRRLGKEPLCLVASGSESLKYTMTRERELGKTILDDQELIKQMRHYDLVDAETAKSPLFKKYYLPIYQMDLKMLSSYDYKENPPLECPIHVLYGDEDPTLRNEAIKDWTCFSNGQVTFQTFSGTHFYFARDKAPLMDYIKKEVLKSGE